MEPEPAPELTTDAILNGRLRLLQPRRGHRLGHDALLLAALAGPDEPEIVDFGAGVGTAALAALARLPEARAVLVERDADLAALAQRNVEANGMERRATVLCADVATLNRGEGPRLSAADLVLANPPFNLASAHRASPDAGRAAAHMADPDLFETWVVAAARCLKPDGRLGLILRPTEITLLLASLKGRFGALRLRPVHARPDAPAVRLLACAVKGRRTPPSFLPGLILADAAGAPTPPVRALLAGEVGL